MRFHPTTLRWEVNLRFPNCLVESGYRAGNRTGDDVVFGHPGDLVLLGSRTLEGLNLSVEPVTKRLVDAGPAPAALVAAAFTSPAFPLSRQGEGVRG
jgi:hypothetical protein